MDYVGKIVRWLSSGAIVKNYLWELLIIIPAFALYMLVIVPSGSTYCFDGSCGIYFWGAHEHDAVWHLSLVQAAFNQIPFVMPIYAGAQLGGYNFLYDFVLYLLRFAGISPLFSYFKLMPLVWFWLYVWALCVFARKSFALFARISNPAFFWYRLSLFLYVFFGSSLGIILGLSRGEGLQGASTLLTMQGALGMTNMQFMFASLGILLLLIMLVDVLQRGVWDWKKSGFTAALVFGILGLKFYAAPSAGIIITCILVTLVLGRRWKQVISLLLLCGLAGLLAGGLFYGLFAPSETTSLIFSPFSTVYPLFEDPQLFYTRERALTLRTLLEGKPGPRLILIHLELVALFLAANLGTRIVPLALLIIGGIFLRKRLRMRHLILVAALLLSILASSAFTFLFIQKGVWWNTVQFYYFAALPASVLCALSCAGIYYVVHRKRNVLLKYAFVFCAFLIGVATVIPNGELLQIFANPTNPTHVPAREVRALLWLASKPKGVVFTPLRIRKKTRVLPEVLNTSYVSAFSGQVEYFASLEGSQLALLGVDYAARSHAVKSLECGVLEQVHYVYMPDATSAKPVSACTFLNAHFAKVYEDQGVRIYQRKNEMESVTDR